MHACSRMTIKQSLLWLSVLLMLFLGITLLVWPPDARMRIGIFPLLAAVFLFRSHIQHALTVLAGAKYFVTGIFILTLFMSILRTGNILYRVSTTPRFMEDIAHIHVQAITDIFYTRKNPYTSKIDPYPVQNRVFDGFKYTPLQLFSYAPTVLLFGLKGIYVFHALIYCWLCFLIFHYLKKYSLLHAYFGVLFFLLSDHISVLSFNNGTNDLLPTFLLTASLMYLRNSKNTASGLALGSSILAKQIPGGLFVLPAIIQETPRTALIALSIFALGCSPFFLWHPGAFFENVFIFSLLRPSRPSSLLCALPHNFSITLQILGLLAIPLLALFGRKWPEWNMRQSFSLPVVGLFIFLITAKMSPIHYFLWITPLYVLWILEPKKEP